MNLWVFGDSYTADGRNTVGSNNWQHIDKTWFEQLAEKLDVSKKYNLAIPGVSNEWIYGKILQEKDNFQKDDYIVIQPTCASRRWLFEDHPDFSNWQNLPVNNKILTRGEISALNLFKRHLINEQAETYNYDMFIRAVMFIAQSLPENKILIMPGFHPIPGIIGTLGNVCFGEFLDSSIENKYYEYHKNDPRINHMHETNHTILATKIYNFFKFNQTVDLTAGFDHSFINKSNYKQNNQLTP